MSYKSEISVHINDYGYSLEFSAEDEDRNPIPLHYLSGVNGLCFEVISGLNHPMWNTCHSGYFTINSISGGLFEFQVPSGWFNQIGVYEGKVHVSISGGIYFTLNDLRISVVGRS